jgi:ribosomal protein S18 acetylase RimI-like enzyme
MKENNLDIVSSLRETNIIDCYNLYVYELYDANELLGTCNLFQYDDGEYKIEGLYIKPDFRNKGKGKYFLNKIIDDIPNNCIIHLMVEQNNEHAIMLYEKLDFVVNYTDGKYIWMFKEK